MRSSVIPTEQPLVNPRMTKGAGDDEIGVLRVEWANSPSTAVLLRFDQAAADRLHRLSDPAAAPE